MIGAIVFLTLAGLTMGLGVFYAIAMGSKIAKAPTWPRAHATIVTSTVKKIGRKQVANIKFRYRAGGTGHSSGNYRLVIGTVSSEEGRRLTEAYPVGRELEIYYDPKMPNLATIELGGNARDYLGIYGGRAMKIAIPGVLLLLQAKFF